MAHTTRNKDQLIARVRRIRGQIESLERALAEEHDCSAILQTVAAARGALNGFMAELVDGHVRGHVLPPSGKATASQRKAAAELLSVVKSYLK